MVLPPDDALANAGTAMPAGENSAKWLGECARRFAEAVSAAAKGAARCCSVENLVFRVPGTLETSTNTGSGRCSGCSGTHARVHVHWKFFHAWQRHLLFLRVHRRNTIRLWNNNATMRFSSVPHQEQTINPEHTP